MSSGSSKGPPAKKRVIIPLRPLFRWIIRLRRSPRAIAGGFALGTFVAFTPTIGIQLIIVIFLATLFDLNRPAAALAVFISNPATMVPLYTFNYYVGTLFWSGPPVREVYGKLSNIAGQLIKLESLNIIAQFETLRQLSMEVFIPLTIGSFIVGIVAAAAVFFGAIALIRYLIMRKERRLRRRFRK